MADIKRLVSPGAAVCGIADVSPDDTLEVKTVDGVYPTNLLIAESKEITITDRFGNDIAFAAGALALGVFHRISFTKVKATGTGAHTAGTIKAGWDG